MATHVIGDIHGDVEKLNYLLDSLELSINDTVIFLGDYINKGNYSFDVIETIIRLKQHTNVVTLLGNHEYTLLYYLNGHISERYWMSFGGRITDLAYPGGDVRSMPDSHIAFFEELLYYYEDEAFIYVHGSYCPYTEMDEQDPDMLLLTFLEDKDRHYSGKVVICGHTPQRNYLPKQLPNTLCIDTCGHYRNGRLTALNVTTGNYVQVDKNGTVYNYSL